MTRLEQIKQEARKRYEELIGTYGGFQIFVKGAEWADANPHDGVQIIDLIHDRSKAYDRAKQFTEALDLIRVILKKYNINHFGKCDVRDKLPCSCGRDEIIIKLKALEKE